MITTAAMTGSNHRASTRVTTRPVLLLMVFLSIVALTLHNNAVSAHKVGLLETTTETVKSISTSTAVAAESSSSSSVVGSTQQVFSSTTKEEDVDQNQDQYVQHAPVQFQDLSSEIVEIFDGYDNHRNGGSDNNHDGEQKEFDNLDDEYLDGDEFDDGIYYFLRHGHSRNDHRRTQESSSSTRVNIFQKLGESLGTTIIGCCLIAIMPCLIWKNEGRHVRELSRIDFCKNKAVAIDCTSPTNETVGRLVQFSGDVTVGDNQLTFLSGDSLNITKPIPHAILLRRICYIYQKFEVPKQTVQKDAIGGGETRTTTYTMREDWTPSGPQRDCPNINETNSRGVWDQLVAGAEGSSQPVTAPEEQSQPTNPPNPFAQGMSMNMAITFGGFNPNRPPHALQVTNTARVGDFSLSEKILTGNPSVFTSDYVAVPSDYIPEYVQGCEFLMKGTDNILRSFPESEQPSNGDVKIVYEYVQDGFAASFLVAQTADPTTESEAKYGVDQMTVTEEHCLGKCQDDLGQIWMVRKGNLTLFEMIDMAKQDEATTVKLIRIVAWVLLCAGWVMLFSPFLTALQVLPLLSQLGYFAVVLAALVVSALCCCTVMILAYLRYRPLLSGGLLAVALAIWGIVAWRLNIAAETGGDTNSTSRF